MNCWGFTPDLFREIEQQMQAFFADSTDGLAKKEFFLPSVVQELIDSRKCDVKVMDTPAKWYGVTYHEDKEKIVAFIEQMIEEGIQSRLSSIGEESQLKLQDAMKRIVNESKGRIICIIL